MQVSTTQTEMMKKVYVYFMYAYLQKDAAKSAYKALLNNCFDEGTCMV